MSKPRTYQPPFVPACTVLFDRFISKTPLPALMQHRTLFTTCLLSAWFVTLLPKFSAVAVAARE